MKHFPGPWFRVARKTIVTKPAGAGLGERIQKKDAVPFPHRFASFSGRA